MTVPTEKDRLRLLAQGVLNFRHSHPRDVVKDRSATTLQDEIHSALNEFMECVRYLNTRRTKGTVLALASESDVQDALFVMLRPWVKDLKYEDPTGKQANRYSIPDFLVPSAQLVIEAKYVRDRKHGKDISKELHDDIEMYRHVVSNGMILFFIFDPQSHIPSTESLKSQICAKRHYPGQEIRVELILKP